MGLRGASRRGGGDRTALHSEQLRGLHWSPNVTRVMKSRRIGWAGHVGFERGNLKAKSHF